MTYDAELEAGEFGDADPEDSWDVGDPVDELVHNLERRVAVLGEPTGPTTHSGDLAERLDDVELAAGRLRDRRDELDDRALLRVGLVFDDIETVRGMLEGGN